MTTWIQFKGYFSETIHPEPVWVKTEDGLIQAIESNPPTDPDASIVKTGAYAMPLLSDSHVHFYMNPWPLEPKERIRPGSGEFEQEVQDAMNRLRKALRMGMGFVRDMGDPHGINLEVKKRVALDPQHYPALQVPGPAIHRPKRYGRFLGVKRASMEEVLELVDSLVTEDNVDFIKVVSTGIVDFEKQQMNQPPQYTVAELAAVVERAAQYDLSVASHCSGVDGIDINLDANVRFIEHAYFITPEQRARMAQSGQFWTPTFAPVYQQGHNDACGWSDPCRQSISEILHQHNEALQSGYNEGINILAGTDAGSPGVEIGEGLLVELKCMANSLPVADLLCMATAGNADALQHPGYRGRIAVGAPASFATYTAAPWEDFDQLGHPKGVWQNGEPVQL
jgi:imidazolonepropionase-like amidohydrolase